jgi:RNA polymerase sigma-70 factor (ECF subfamily)
MNPIEKEIFGKIREGDIKAFDFLFISYYPSLCAYAKDLVKMSEIAEEVVQDVFLKLWNKRSALSVQTSLKAYMYRMVHNHCLNYIRDHSTQKAIKTLYFEDLQTRIALIDLESPGSIFDDLLSEQIENDLNKAIDGLPEHCKKIFQLCRFQGLSYPEIAEQLDISLSTVKTQMLRAIEKLKEVMLKYQS